VPGVATGMAGRRSAATYSSSRPRASRHGKLILTGQLGDVMKSAQAALSLVKSKHRELGSIQLFDESDIHVHVRPRHPKDGRARGWRCSPPGSLVTDAPCAATSR